MPLIRVNIAGGQIARPDEAEAALRAVLPPLPAATPVIVLIHGYKFSPTTPARDPHTHILSLDPRPGWKAVSWPRRLGLGRDSGRDPGLGQGPEPEPGPEPRDAGGHEPLCIALGWEARGSLWQAYGRAAEAGRGLAQVIGLLRSLRRGASISVLAHSLGGRVALSALPHLPARALDRAVLMAAAEMQSHAAYCLDTPAGRSVEVLNIVSHQNILFDRGLEWLMAPHRRGERAVGRGLARERTGWLDLRVDEPGVRRHLADLGVSVSKPARPICHWSVYLCPSLFDLYRAVLSGDLPLSVLARSLALSPPPHPPRRRVWQSLPLPFPRHEAS